LAHLHLNGLTDFFKVSLLISSIRFQSPPYSMFKESAEKMVGNDAFEGYAIDLISEIAQILSEYITFTYLKNYGMDELGAAFKVVFA
jgi:hypothetical protein